MEDVSRVLNSKHGLALIQDSGDVPVSLSHGTSSFPLGRYLRGKLRENMGFPSKDTPQIALYAFAQKMHQLFSEAFKTPEGKAAGSLSNVLVGLNAQKVLNLEFRTKIYADKKEI